MNWIKKFIGYKKSKFSSGDYWDARYRRNRTSGAGSYGRLAEYKATFINGFVAEQEISNVIEFGSGDGNQAALFDFDTYTGVDISPTVVQRAKTRFSERKDWSFFSVGDPAYMQQKYDLALSLDVIYHLVEDEVFEAYMTDLLSVASDHVLIYASDHNALTPNDHVRHRAFSIWMGENAPEFKRVQSWENPYPMTEGADPEHTSFAFFTHFRRNKASVE